MEDRLSTVLEIYHARLREEKRLRRELPDEVWKTQYRPNALLAVGPDSGALINVLARNLKAPRILELGTSFGYSGLWLADAARQSGGHVTTIEREAHKSDYARDRAVDAGLDAWITHRVGDVLDEIALYEGGIDFVLLDVWKDLYVPCLEAFFPKLNPGAIVVADNMARPGSAGSRAYEAAMRAKPGITSILVPVGQGLEISRYEP